jgi:hypothetical protein
LSQEEVDRLAASVIAERATSTADAVAAPTPMTRPRAVRIAFAIALPIFAGLLVANFAWQPVMTLFERELPAPVAARQAQEMLDELVADIDAYRTDYDELPVNLVDVGVPARGQWRYVSLGPGQFRVEGTLQGHVVSFDSTSAASKPVREQP